QVVLEKVLSAECGEATLGVAPDISVAAETGDGIEDLLRDERSHTGSDEALLRLPQEALQANGRLERAVVSPLDRERDRDTRPRPWLEEGSKIVLREVAERSGLDLAHRPSSPIRLNPARRAARRSRGGPEKARERRATTMPAAAGAAGGAGRSLPSGCWRGGRASSISPRAGEIPGPLEARGPDLEPVRTSRSALRRPRRPAHALPKAKCRTSEVLGSSSGPLTRWHRWARSTIGSARSPRSPALPAREMPRSSGVLGGGRAPMASGPQPWGPAHEDGGKSQDLLNSSN